MKGFATYRLPDANEAIHIEGEVEVIGNLEDIREQQGYLVAPFDISRHETLLIKPETLTGKPLCCNGYSNGHCNKYPVTGETMYEPAFNLFHEKVASGAFHKLVLSRAVTLDRGLAEAEEIFFRACARYPHQMVAMFDIGYGNKWLIITPEILLTSSTNGIFKTIALAGTMPADSTCEWSIKNRQEQKVVADYIQSTLVPFCDKCSMNGPYSVSAGGVQHLRTDFEFSCREGYDIGNILSSLHPTPAVCGMPKEQAQKFIRANEGYDREYYSGFSGPLNIDGHSELYVTLRCAKIDNRQAILYAGGGIMPESEITSEKMETSLKMETIISII